MVWTTTPDGSRVWVEIHEDSTPAAPVPPRDDVASNWVTDTTRPGSMTEREWEATLSAEAAAAAAIAARDTALGYRTDFSNIQADITVRHGDIQDRHAAIVAVGVGTAADAAQTASDRVATAADRVATGQDRAAIAGAQAATAADRIATGQDRTATGQDKAATAADRVQTGQDRTTATGAATTATGARDAALGYRDTTKGYRDETLTARDVTTGARDATIAARDLTLGYRDTAKGYRDEALTFRNEAATFVPANFYDKATVDTKLATKADKDGGNVLTGAQTFRSSPGGPGNIYIERPAGQTAYVTFRSDLKSRWQFGVDSSSESGNNAGSKFAIKRFDDAGSVIDSPLVVDRKSGIATLAYRPLFGTAIPWDDANFDPATKANLVGKNTFSGDASPIKVQNVPGEGFVTLNTGSTTGHPGYVAFNKSDGTRVGYIGWGDPAGAVLELQGEAGYGWRFNQPVQNKSQPWVQACRGVGWENPPAGTTWGIVGQIPYNQGGWYTGGIIGASGYALHVPKTGRYLITMSIYAGASSNGRMNLRCSDGRTLCFIQTGARTGDQTMTVQTIKDLAAGQYIYYVFDVAAVYFYSGQDHSDVNLYYLG